MKAAANDIRLKIPKKFTDLFKNEVPVLIKYHPAGLWPLDPLILKGEIFQKLVQSREFKEQFDVVLVPRAMK